MFLSTFDLFKVGIGPSSSHTVGPMIAAKRFLDNLNSAGKLQEIVSLQVSLYGSLALTGKGHATDRALLLGLSGHDPATIDPEIIDGCLDAIRGEKQVKLLGRCRVAFDETRDIHFRMDELLPHHSNGMEFTAFDKAGEQLAREAFYSVGGGFVVSEQELGSNYPAPVQGPVPYPFDHASDLLATCRDNKLRISDLMLANEMTLQPKKKVLAGLDHLYGVMEACIDRGCAQEGILPGGLKVERRAKRLYGDLQKGMEKQLRDPAIIMDWINLWALAVNEENAAGGRVVTAPTNGAAGILPAVLRYFDRFYNQKGREGIHCFLLTAAAIGSLYKKNASISGAEVGCQGEVGVACSMAAGGLAAALGGSNEQVENAAEIGMEHNLGLTCDPVGGLVQVPCIERNAMGAIKAVDAARLALRGDGRHMVSLDRVIETMRQTGRDMQEKYKETSKGGLAVNMVEC
ncbi:L-serine ammonia-lyase [Emcibacter nanhaiensis]|uniref:L-serine dehydratase n=1 Tax=Emcibacter nanhaiensis TaxID=1505037 RepID=A0A501PFE4_9PROT|nr:L-serine ammonia-lyase [Emcibacter nanhaiensis]TPD58905.1 L-serine ammonia-lyase [Emcibacter nanhaiensis]